MKIRVDYNPGRGTKKMSPEVYRAVIEEAHARGLRVAAHLDDLDDAEDLARAGVDLLAHSVRDREVDEELIALLREKRGLRRVHPDPGGVDVRLCFGPAFFDDPFFRRAADAAVLEQLLRPRAPAAGAREPAAQCTSAALGTASGNLLRLARAGVPIAFGTDSGPPAASRATSSTSSSADGAPRASAARRAGRRDPRRRPLPALATTSAPSRRASARTSSCSTPIRSRTCATCSAFTRCGSAGGAWSAPPSDRPVGPLSPSDGLGASRRDLRLGMCVAAASPQRDREQHRRHR